MRSSCNGCRVLRKGCADDCPIRPSLVWLADPDHQANATLFLAKFYGRAGLLNLLSSAPNRLRHAVFRSLLYEACGRVINPIYGAVGLLSSGNWKSCQAAVEAVLKGEPVVRIAPEDTTAAAAAVPPIKAFDIRHVNRDDGIHGVAKASHAIFKRSGGDSARREAIPRADSTEDGSMVSVETIEFAEGERNLKLELSLSLGGSFR